MMCEGARGEEGVSSHGQQLLIDCARAYLSGESAVQRGCLVLEPVPTRVGSPLPKNIILRTSSFARWSRKGSRAPNLWRRGHRLDTTRLPSKRRIAVLATAM